MLSKLLWVESVFYRELVVPLIAFLPARIAYGIAVIEGQFRWMVDSPIRLDVEQTMAIIFAGRLNPRKLSLLSLKFFRLRACEKVDITRLMGNGRALTRLVNVEGLQHLNKALALGRGVVICSAHYGSYQAACGVLGSMGFPIALVGRLPKKTGPISRLVTWGPLTHHFRFLTIQPKPGRVDTARRAVSVIRQNGAVIIFPDAGVKPADRNRTVQVNFLGRNARLLPGSESIARVANSPVLMMFIHRSADWRHQVIRISPPLEAKGDILTSFQKCIDAIGRAIIDDPAHWKRWRRNLLDEMGLLSGNTGLRHQEIGRSSSEGPLPKFSHGERDE